MLGNILDGDGNSLGDETLTNEQTDEVGEFLSTLDAELRNVLPSLKTTDWVKAFLKYKNDPTMNLTELLGSTAEDLALRMKLGTDGQFDLAAASSDNQKLDLSVEESAHSMSNKEILIRMSKNTPVRLAYGEREFLRLLESALYISDYTDQIDIYHTRNKKLEIVREIRHICSILTGLVMARDYEIGQRLLKDHNFEHLEQFFKRCFEIGRRYKTINPDRMRDSYGKLMYFLMDSRNEHVRDLLKFDCVEPIKTVWTVLNAKKNGMAMLQDPLMIAATAELYGENLSHRDAELQQKKRNEATKTLIAKYATRPSAGSRAVSSWKSWFSTTAKAEDDRLQISFTDLDSDELTEEDVEILIYSIRDHWTSIRYNVKPVEKLLEYLVRWFKPDSCDPANSLAIRRGVQGARLTHDHELQYCYVQQTLELWIEILMNFIELWMLSDADLLDSTSNYALCDTGQGYQRIKGANQVRRKMNEILRRVASKHRDSTGTQGVWVGSSVVHIGDHNVPNSFHFIDKYMQVPRIVGPIILVLQQLERFEDLIKVEFESIDHLRKVILQDFFRHGFDGSGADNFYDAGSCIDGRLTSAWNWCNTIEKKKYYPYFLLCGFQGFDGKF